MTTRSISQAVATKFCAPEWATFFEVCNGTGMMQRRSADAIAMNLFPSRGLRLHGFEFKASRSDWLRELKDPHKSDSIQRYCDHWWIVTLPDIVKDDELPPTWGLYVLKGSGLHTVQKAPQLEKQVVDAPFLAALLRRAHEFGGRELHKEIDRKLASERASMNNRIAEQVKYKTRDLERYKEAIEAFEQAAGFPLETWDAASYGAAAKLVRELGVTTVYSSLQSTADAARRFADRVEAAFPRQESEAA